MESAPGSAVLDEPEEGEIVDDDFEDISDNSITMPLYSGKSVSSKEHLPAISLSSVSEAEEQKKEIKSRHCRKSLKRRNSKSSKKRRSSHHRSISIDSDSDDYLELDRKLHKQLKAAIKIDTVEESHKNSLRSRLKAMTKLNGDSVDKKDEFIESNNEKEEKASSDEGDNELIQLRLEALRTAVLNKFMHRKKRKVKEVQTNDGLSDISIKTDISETNKENNIAASSAKRLCTEKAVDNKMEIKSFVIENTIPEEDEDVLRAVLLASMSKKITNKVDIKQAVIPKKTILPSSNTNNIIKHSFNTKLKNNEMVTNRGVKNMAHIKNYIIQKSKVKNQPVQLPKIKPVIINVNGDSDSDDESFNKMDKDLPKIVETQKKINTEIESSVDKFLKEQRAKVEAQIPPVTKPIVNTSKSLILEKSSVKLLPKVKQIEYHKLLQRLKNAERRPRTRRLSYRLNTDSKLVGNTSKKLIRNKTLVHKQVNTKADPTSDPRNEVRNLHKVLKEIQIQKNGRLQIQEKYVGLAPIIKKINEASLERKKADQEVKRLLEELAEAKQKLLKSQQNFTTHVKELIIQKEGIDKSSRKSGSVETKTYFTSTPIKEKLPLECFDASSITKITPNNSLPIPKYDDNIGVIIDNLKQKGGTDLYVNPGDPNDIDKIYNKQKESIPKYISPLDNVKRLDVADPFSVVCPYDVDGNCRDPECIYKHIFK